MIWLFGGGPDGDCGMVLNGEGGLECEMYTDGIHLEHTSEFKYLWCFLQIRVQSEGGEWE